MNIPSKQAIVEIASTSWDQDILYSYVAIENDHTVEWSYTAEREIRFRRRVRTIGA